MNRIALKYAAREMKRGDFRDLRLTIQSYLLERDPRGGRPVPFLKFTDFNAAGAFEFSLDLPPEEWEKIIAKLQKKIHSLKGREVCKIE